MSGYKQAILLREDLEMSKGKMIAQGSHASLKAYRKAKTQEKEKWESQGEKKIVLGVDASDLTQRFQRAKDEGLPAALITDAGKTEVDPGTKTAAAIGPAQEDKIDSITGDLKLIQ